MRGEESGGDAGATYGGVGMIVAGTVARLRAMPTSQNRDMGHPELRLLLK
jgi:hypothetical protein